MTRSSTVVSTCTVFSYRARQNPLKSASPFTIRGVGFASTCPFSVRFVLL